MGIGTTAPEVSAAMDVSSNSKGFLPPRMTTSERDNISDPEPGMMVYNTDMLCLNFYNGQYWANMGYDSTICGFPFTDPRDGQVYQTVKIGDQCWMAENLNARVYPNGDSIPYITTEAEWGALADNNTDDGCCNYLNTPGSGYGLFYSYAAAIGDNWERDHADGQGVCPDGWKLPTNDEWQELFDFLGGIEVAGGKMKEAGTTHWDSPNTGATNESGFTALPGSFRFHNNGYFVVLGTCAYWWSVSEFSNEGAYYHILGYKHAKAFRDYNYKSHGFSVRCLRNND